jgi:trans-aconitate 2-methyltransferase
VAQCGGQGNIDRFRSTAEAVAHQAPYAEHSFENPWNYADAEATAQRLQTAGFADVRTWLQPKPTPLPDPKPFVTTVCLLPYLERLPEALREPFVDAVLERCEQPLVLDYVRLNMTARRSS